MNEAADRSREAGMEENVKAVFISNYINHHQIPFSNALYEQLGDDYHFIQTEPMEEERIAMGWGLDAATLPYVVWADRSLRGGCLQNIKNISGFETSRCGFCAAARMWRRIFH